MSIGIVCRFVVEVPSDVQERAPRGAGGWSEYLWGGQHRRIYVDLQSAGASAQLLSRKFGRARVLDLESSPSDLTTGLVPRVAATYENGRRVGEVMVA